MHRLDHFALRARLCAFLLLVLSASTLGSSRASAGVDPGVRAGVYTDLSAFALGGELLSSMGSRWFFNPNVEVAFADGGNLTTINGDFHYDLPSDGLMSVYLGGGPALLLASSNRGGGSNTDFGVNLLAGISGVRGSARPFVQSKVILSGGTDVAFMGGIRF